MGRALTGLANLSGLDFGRSNEKGWLETTSCLARGRAG